MIIITKKRLAIIGSILLLAVFAFTFQTASLNNTVQTVSLPVSNKVIVLDAGHGKPDEGAESSNRNHRGGNKLKNSIKATKFVRAKWCNSNSN